LKENKRGSRVLIKFAYYNTSLEESQINLYFFLIYIIIIVMLFSKYLNDVTVKLINFFVKIKIKIIMLVSAKTSEPYVFMRKIDRN
jgi:hypothetical protein